VNPSEPQPRRPSWVPQLFILTAALSASTGAGIVAMQSLPPMEVFGQRFEPPRLNLFPSEQSFPPRQGWPVYDGRPVEEPGDALGGEGDQDPGAVRDPLEWSPERRDGPRDRALPPRPAPLAPAAPRQQELNLGAGEGPDSAPPLDDRPSFDPAIAPEADDRPPRRPLNADGDRATPDDPSPAPAPQNRPPINNSNTSTSGSGSGNSSNSNPDPGPAAAPRPIRDMAPAPIAPPPPPSPIAPPPPPPITADPPGG
jgi:hypothetical protein